MALTVHDVANKYAERLEYLESNMSQYTRPTLTRLITVGTRDFYQRIIDLVDSGNFNYLTYIQALTEQFKDKNLLSVDPDNKLSKLADQILNHPKLIDHWKEEIYKDGVRFDLTVYKYSVRSMNRALDII